MDDPSGLASLGFVFKNAQTYTNELRTQWVGLYALMGTVQGHVA